jgi:histidinol-phosphate aminotransferase
MKYWNSRLKNAAEYIPGEQPGDAEKLIKLNTNENPFPPFQSVIKAITAQCGEALRLYPDPSALQLRKAFADKNSLSPDNVFAANGSDEVFSLIFRGFIEPDGVAAYPYPSYSLYGTMAELNGIKYETVPLGKDFSFNLAPFLKKKYSVVLISNPNNPTGTYCSLDEIKKFLKSYTGLLVVDEAYVDFYGGSAVELVKDYDNLIVTRSFSKSYSLAGLRVGLAAACPEIIRGFMKIKDSYNIDRLAIAGAAAALLDDKAFRYNTGMVVSNKEYLEDRLEALGFASVPSRANFILTRHPDIKSSELYTALKERKILVRHFKSQVVSDYIRISVGSMMDIKTLCKELEAIISAV